MDINLIVVGFTDRNLPRFEPSDLNYCPHVKRPWANRKGSNCLQTRQSQKTSIDSIFPSEAEIFTDICQTDPSGAPEDLSDFSFMDLLLPTRQSFVVHQPLVRLTSSPLCLPHDFLSSLCTVGFNLWQNNSGVTLNLKQEKNPEKG